MYEAAPSPYTSHRSWPSSKKLLVLGLDEVQLLASSEVPSNGFAILLADPALANGSSTADSSMFMAEIVDELMFLGNVRISAEAGFATLNEPPANDEHDDLFITICAESLGCTIT